MTQVILTSSVLILVMALARLVLRKRVSQRLIYGMWLLVALRLLIPVQFGQSRYSVTTVAQPATQQVQQVVSRPISGPSREEVYDRLVEDYLAQTPQLPDSPEMPVTPTAPEVTVPAPTVPEKVQTQLRQEAEKQVTAPSLGEVLTGLWIAGVVAMGVWFLTANLLFLRKIRRDSTVIARSEGKRQSPETTENLGGLPRQCAHWLAMTGKLRLRLCPHLDTPCLVGLFRPTVCLTPVSLGDEDVLRHVLTHETTHLRHGDHIWSAVRCFCLCIYWFNPLVWLAAILSKRDQELACDEAALEKLGEQDRIPYGKTLLTIVSHSVTPGKILQTATSMSETKKQLKERIEFIVKQPKNLWFAAISLILIAALTTGCVFTGKPNDQPSIPSTGTTEPTDPTISTEPEPASPLYEDILKDYDDLIAAQLTGTFRADYSEGRYQEGEALTRAQKRNEDLGIRWGYMLWDMTTGLSDPGKNSFGSITRDINGDGVPELFWIREDKTLLAVFTIIEDEPIVLDAYWARCDAVMTDDGKLYRINSGGAANSYYDIMTLSTEGKLVAEQSFGMNGGSAETGTLYYEVVDGEQTAITEARFNELLAAYPFQWGDSWFSAETTILQQGQRYVILQQGPFSYRYQLFDVEGNIIEDQETSSRYPQISMITDNILEVQISYGTGIVQHHYLDLQTDRISSIYEYVACTNGDLIAYLDGPLEDRQLIVESIFGKTSLYRKLDLDFAPEHIPVTQADFSEDGSSILLTYRQGSDGEVVSENISLYEFSKPIYIQNPPDSAFYGRWTAHVFIREGATLSYSLELGEDGSATYTMGYYGSDLLEKMEGTWQRTEDGLYLLELTPRGHPRGHWGADLSLPGHIPTPGRRGRKPDLCQINGWTAPV